MKILSVVGARPNFMKLAPLSRALASREGVDHRVVHTGQHYDRNMSDSFFDDLGIAEPHYNLEVGSGSHAQQTGAIMQLFEPVCLETTPDLVVVYGDVNSTVAAALVASKLGIRVAHVEAGLRSRDWTMPEEINRVVTDRLSDLLFTPSIDGNENLEAEGVPAERVHLVGNIMVDSLVYALPHARAAQAAARHELRDREYTLVTLHRPSNVDDPATLAGLLDALVEISAAQTVLFPVHPRTRQRMASLRWDPGTAGDLRLIEPVGYLEMLSLVTTAGTVLTDSGGLQEETTYLGVPCVTVRPNTERPITCSQGTARLVASTKQAVIEAVAEAPFRRMEGGAQIDRWDGKTGERIANVVCEGAAGASSTSQRDRVKTEEVPGVTQVR